MLGLSAVPEPGPRIKRYARAVACPVFLILQRDDDTAGSDRARALFDLLASSEKTLVESPGGHEDVPQSVFERAYEFLARHIGA